MRSARTLRTFITRSGHLREFSRARVPPKRPNPTQPSSPCLDYPARGKASTPPNAACVIWRRSDVAAPLFASTGSSSRQFGGAQRRDRSSQQHSRTSQLRYDQAIPEIELVELQQLGVALHPGARLAGL